MDFGITVNKAASSTIDGSYTWLWRHCCLDKMKDVFAMKDCKGSKILASNYNWCFTRDIGALTITGRAKSMIRKGGLVYSQFYLMSKLQFDSTKRFPWDERDDTMAAMAVNSTYQEAIRLIMGAKARHLPDCRESYNHCGRRFMLGVRTNDDKSWGAREEHRVTLALLMAMNEEFQSRGCPEIRLSNTRMQFYVMKTNVVNRFTECVTLPYARWYQEILGMVPEGLLGSDRQKMAILLSLLVKNSYSCTMIEKYPMIWERKVQHNGGVAWKVLEELHKAQFGFCFF